MTSLALGQMRLPTTVRMSLVTVEPCPLADAWPVLIRHHYLHRRRTMAQLAYAVVVRGVVDGYLLYALPFGRGARDGVPTMQCLELARLWLASNVKYTASGAIMATLRRVRADWGVRYPHLPPVVAVCSYSDEGQHTGAVYQHAGFTDCGPRRCPPQGHRMSHADATHDTRLWMYRFERVAS